MVLTSPSEGQATSQPAKDYQRFKHSKTSSACLFTVTSENSVQSEGRVSDDNEVSDALSMRIK